VRITAQLIAATDGSHLWSQRYDRELADVFAIQDEIAQAVAMALQVTLSVGSTLRRYTPALPAYEAYLKARHHWAKTTPESLARSRDYYEQAIALDPEFALAHIGLADYFLLMTIGVCLVAAHEAMPLVRAAAQRALEIDPALPDAHAMLGIVSGLYDYDWKEAERRFLLATAREPAPPQVRQWYGYFYLRLIGRPHDAVGPIERAVHEDPLNTVCRLLLADCLRAADRPEDAISEERRILELDDQFWFAYVGLARSHLWQGMVADALPFAAKGYALAPWNSYAAAVFAAVLTRSGDTGQADRVLQGMVDTPDAYGTPRGMCFFHLMCEDLDRAADWLERMIEQRDPTAVRCDLIFPPDARRLTRNTRWRALNRMFNLPEPTA
jgi:serine/threonine-protein kinase